MSYLHKREYSLFNFGRCTVHSGNAERLRLDNLLLFMLHELVFMVCHLQFVSYPHMFTSYSYSCKILQPYLEAKVRMSSDAVFILHSCSTKQSSHKCLPLITSGGSYKPISLWIWSPATCESVLNQSDAVTVINLVSTKSRT